MKLFALYATIELTHTPSWLEHFRAEYDEHYSYHSTLKQPCYISADKIPALKATINKFFATVHQPTHSIAIRFSVVKADEADGIIMLASPPGNPIELIQQQLVTALKEFTDYYEPEAKTWEQNFHPHITIARHLDTAAAMAEAMAKVPNHDFPTGTINTITLAVVNEISPEEAARPENLTIYSL